MGKQWPSKCSYNETGEVFIPNEEVRGAFVSSITDGGWESVYQAIRESESLMKATLEMDETAEAKKILVCR